MRGINLDIRRGERFGIAGESGSGKTTLINAILRLLPGTGQITGGSIVIKDIDLTRIDHQLRDLCGTAAENHMQGMLDKAMKNAVCLEEQFERLGL